MKYSFAIGCNANMTPSQFEKICDGVDVSINLFSEVGNGYFEDIILPYKGSLASFQIDASKINDREILVFVLSVKSRDLEPDLFDIKQDFEGDLNAYREVVKEKVLKA